MCIIILFQGYEKQISSILIFHINRIIVCNQCLTHWARFSFLRKFLQDVIFMGSSLLVNALKDLFVIFFRLFIVLFLVLLHNESFFASNWNCLSQFFVLFHVIYNMCEKQEENSRLFSVILILLSFSI